MFTSVEIALAFLLKRWGFHNPAALALASAKADAFEGLYAQFVGGEID